MLIQKRVKQQNALIPNYSHALNQGNTVSDARTSERYRPFSAFCSRSPEYQHPVLAS